MPRIDREDVVDAEGAPCIGERGNLVGDGLIADVWPMILGLTAFALALLPSLRTQGDAARRESARSEPPRMSLSPVFGPGLLGVEVACSF